MRLFCIVLSLLCCHVLAQNYPVKPVVITVPFPAGTSTDVVGREVAQILSKANGVAFVVENKPGAQGLTGAALVARAPKDGYSLLFGNNTTQAAAPWIAKNLSYDPIRDFEPIARIGAVVLSLVVRSDAPFQSTEQLIDFGKKHPGQLKWGYANGANQVSGAAITTFGNLDAIGVPYKGVPQMLTDLIGGSIDFTVADVTNVSPLIKAGRLKALAVTSSESIESMPNVMPLSRTISGFSLLGWFALFAPVGTPLAYTSKLSEQILSGLQDKEVQERLKSSGILIYPGTSEELRKFVASESEKWRILVRNANIQPE